MATIKLNGITVHYEMWNETAETTLVLLHGFTGSTKTWHELIPLLPNDIRLIAFDCIGHGVTDAPLEVAQYTMSAQISLLKGAFEALKIERCHLLGYSMGGRVALSFAVQYPECITSLILESASPGLKDAASREERRASDAQLAARLERDGIEAFTLLWESIPLFETQKRLDEVKQASIRAERLDQRAIGLANSLRGMGTGDMPSLWHKLSYLSMPVTLITGELDSKFISIAKRMLTKIPQAQHVIINEVGHAIHVENPEKFATIVKETISYTI